jgi:phospholipid/cholesterol/gamma-HCH transport system ATP-binding protein
MTSAADRGGDELVAEGLVKRFGERLVLRGVSLRVPHGGIVAIVGASGSGKTVLLDHLTGLMTPDEGRVLVADHGAAPGPDGSAPLVDLATLDDEALDRVRLSWAIVFQRNALFSGTVLDNIALWLREHTALNEAQILRRVRESLEAVQLDVDDVIEKDRDSLSGGMAKRVAIARAIAVDPAVIFYDEPTTGLDPRVSGHIHDLIHATHHRPRSDGLARTSVVVTHDKDLLRRIRPTVVMIDAGRIVFNGSYEAFTRSEVPEAVDYLRQMPVLQGRTDGPHGRG